MGPRVNYCCRSISVIRTCKKMKAFSLEKVLKTGSGGQVRLGCLQLPIPGGANNTSTVTVKEDGGTNPDLGPGSTATGENGISPSSSADRRVYRTPMYFIHTQTGTVPHITPEVFKLIYPTAAGTGPDESSPTPPLQVSVDSTIKFADSLEKFQKGIGKYVGFPELSTFLTIHDPLQALRSGHNDKFGIAMWSRHGRSGLAPERFAETLKSYQCTLSQVISDYDVRPGDCGMKRFRKSMSRAEEYTSYVLKENSKGGCKQTGVFITIEAAWFEMDEGLAKKTVANLLEAQQEIEGVVVAGIMDRFTKGTVKSKPKEGSRYGGDTERLDICEDINGSLEVVEKVVQALPSNLPKFAPGPFKLVQIVDLIAKGIDIFDSSVASRMADDAETFLLDKVEAKLPLLSRSLRRIPTLVNESLPERSNINGGGDPDGNEEKESLPEEAVISLKSKRYFDDFGPISKTCTCYTCRKHTRSYVHHLFATDELLGPVLIQMHNLTTLDRFFNIMRAIIEDSDTAEALQEKFDLVKELLATVGESSSDDEGVEVKLKSNSTS